MAYTFQNAARSALMIRYLTASLALLLSVSAAAQNDPYPSKPVRVVVPFSAGSPIEVPARAVTQRMMESLGQPFVFDYRTGASGTIGTEAVARAPKDGYTVLMTNCSHTANPAYYKTLPYDPINDFQPVSQINSTYGNVLVVHPSLPAKSIAEFIALAKTRPGLLHYGSAGVGSPPHVTAALFAAITGVNLTHVPYKGTAVAFSDVLGGHIEVMTASLTAVIPYVKSGRLRAIGIGGPRRAPLLPTVPTFDESGLKGFDLTCYNGIWLPAGTPPSITRKLSAESVKAVALPQTRKILDESGFFPVGNSAAEFAEFLQKDLLRQAEIVRKIGLIPQ